MAGKLKTMDGNEAAAYVSYAFTAVVGAYDHYVVFSHG